MLWMLQPFVGVGGKSKEGSISLAGLARLLEEENGTERIVERLDGSRGRGERRPNG
jgi:hypothetical protein